jgi:molybdate transport system regulatory protein
MMEYHGVIFKRILRMARMSIRIDFGPAQRLGPGKVRLLQTIEETGSISAAGRALGMSYRRAWELVADLNECFGEALVDTQMGGKKGGGAHLTPFGKELVTHYRAIEAKAEKAAASHLKALQSATRRQRA